LNDQGPNCMRRWKMAYGSRGEPPPGTGGDAGNAGYEYSIPGYLAHKVVATRGMIDGERKHATVLCVDAVGFNSLSTKLDPGELQELVRPCILIMAEEVHRHEGTIAQFSGDGLMAMFGAPVALEDAPHRALYAALAMKSRLSSHRDELEGEGIEFDFRIGINTGLVIVAKRDDRTVEYTALGNAVNLASQLKETASSGRIHVSESTYRFAAGFFDFEDLGVMAIEGRARPARTFMVLRPRIGRTRIELILQRGLSRFIGRTDELECLEKCYREADGGSARVVGVTGEPGVGKSRLVLEFEKSLPADGRTYLEGGCFYYGESVAYLPVLQILRRYFEITEASDEALIKEQIDRRLKDLDIDRASVLPPLQDVMSLSLDDEEYLALEPLTRRARVFEALTTLFVAESCKRTLVMTVEDLQWIDRTSEEFLAHLVDNVASERIMLVLPFRPEYQPAYRDMDFYSEIKVDDLPPESSGDLVSAVLEGAVSRELGEFVTSRAAGNPLFIEELTRSLLEGGSVEMKEGIYDLKDLGASELVPGTVQGIIAARLDRLGGDEKAVIQVASVIGREFTFGLLAAVTRQESSYLKGILGRLQSLEFIYEKKILPEREYAFKHVLTREVAYDSTLIKIRKDLHEGIARAIEQFYADRLEEFYEILARHYIESSNALKAVEYLELSGDKAAGNYANPEAVGFYSEAIRVLDSLPVDDRNRNDKVRICLAAATPLQLTGYPEGSREILEEAERLSEGLADSELLAAAYAKLSTFSNFTGNLPLGLEYSEKCFAEAENIGAVNLMALNGVDLSVGYFLAGQYAKVVGIGDRLIHFLEQNHLEKEVFDVSGLCVYSNICSWSGMSLVYLGDYREARRVLEKGLNNAMEMDARQDIATLYAGFNVLQVFQGDAKGLLEYSRKAIEEFEKTTTSFILGFAWAFLAAGHLMTGDVERAIEYAEKGLRMQMETGIPLMIPPCYYVLSLSYLEGNRLKDAQACAEDALKMIQAHNTEPFEAWMRPALGRIIGQADPACMGEALELISEGIAVAEDWDLDGAMVPAYLFRGELLVMKGDRREAKKSLETADEYCRKNGIEPHHYWQLRTSEALAGLQ